MPSSGFFLIQSFKDGLLDCWIVRKYNVTEMDS
jgi:hypothetical protein